MTSITTKADAVKAAVSSTATCTSTTTVTLRELLIPESSTASATSIATKRTTRRAPAKPTSRTHSRAASRADDAGLSAKEREILATHVINAALKSLTEAAKASQASKRNETTATPRRPDASLRRSLSTPLSPLQSRALNRTSTTIEAPANTKSAKYPPSTSSAYLSTVECARVAFMCLRSLKGPASSEKSLELEMGMSAFVGKLLALDLHEQALKELRVLKQRLEERGAGAAKKTAKTASSDAITASRTLSDLLDFREGSVLPNTRQLVVSTQLYALRIMAHARKPGQIEAVVPLLRESRKTSPISLLLQSARDNPKEAAKVARQTESLSAILFSLTPGCSSKVDGEAMEQRLHPSPTFAFELQTVALRTRLYNWKIVGRRGDVDKEILLPFSRSLAAFGRRLNPVSSSAHNLCEESYLQIQKMIAEQDLTPSQTSKSPVAAVYQSLGSSALSLKRNEDANTWVEKLHGMLDPEVDSTARRISVTAQLLAVCLKCKLDEGKVIPLLTEVIEGIQGMFRGETSELDDLLVDLSLARRSAVGVLVSASVSGSSVKLSPQLTELLETFVTQYPRFTIRWLGKPPTRDGNTKDFLRFDTRRQAVEGTLSQLLDGALVVTKTRLTSGKVEWSSIDNVLQDCLELLERMGDMKASANGNTYYVKISNLYYMKYALSRQDSAESGDATPLRALRRSLDAIRDRTSREKEAGQYVTKLERFADACARSKRMDQAKEAFQSICTAMVEDGVLSKIAALLNEQPPALAWSNSDRSEALSRTLCSIAKIDKSWTSWTCFLSEIERAAVLEHLIQTITSGESGKNPEPLKLSDPLVESLLRIYTLEKFPVRRLRTLLHVFAMNMTNPDQAHSIQSQIEVALEEVSSGEFGEDEGLGRYVPHLRAYFTSILAMPDWSLNNDLQCSLSLWRTIAEKSNTCNDIFNRIDNPAVLSTHLKAIADLASMRGDSSLLVSTLELLAELSKKTKEPALDEVLANCNLLASHYANLGYTDKAEAVLGATKELISQADKVSGEAVAEFHLSVAEQCIATGSFDKAELCLAEARAAFIDNPVRHRSRASSMTALAGLLYSIVALEKGESQPALQYAKDSVRAVIGDWMRLETSANASGSPDSDMSDLSMSGGLEGGESQASVARVIRGSNFWAITYPVIRSVLRLSALYAHMGMFQETVHYAERALKVAQSSGSPLYIAQCSAWVGSVWVKGAKPEKGLEFVRAARDFVVENPRSPHSVPLACQLAELHRIMGDTKSEGELLRLAESALQHAKEPAEAVDSRVAGIGDEMEKLSIAEKPTTTRTTRASRTTRSRAATVTSTKKPAPRKTTRTRAITVSKPAPPPEDTRLSLMRASVLLYKALGHIHQKDWAAAMDILEQMTVRPTGSDDIYREQMIRAVCLVGQSLNDMIRDPVFSALQDSTISFPAVAQSKATDAAAGSGSPVKTPPARKPSKSRGGSRFVDALVEAQNHLLEANSAAVVRGDGGLVHRISSLLQSTVIFLSATSTKCGIMGHPGYASCAIEVARNVTWRRERKALQIKSSPAKIEWPAGLPSIDARHSNLCAASDISRFQRDYVDIIPSSWTVISISPSDNREDLCITKLQAGHTPFVLRLPLERATSRDADTEIFSFQHGLDELRGLIAEANTSSHTARDMAAKGAKAAWWRARGELDERFGELLRGVEEVWLGGFRGIFSQEPRRTGLLARFQTSFHNILDKYLPSRRRVRGRRSPKAAKVTFDPRILELFIGLGAPGADAEDLYEPLTDLLYFVIDILQFRGEQNAYDEIDFDGMIVDTLDALMAYHQAAEAEGADGAAAHTVLVLDKSLHAFPWESLPCMQGLAVSRVPSLACLRRLILEQQPADDEEDSRPGHHVSGASGTYILNPASDLTNTLSLFEEPLSDLGPSWTPIVSRAPTEAEFQGALENTDVMLYFGHGSGAQYLRGKTLRGMEKCRAAALLMGCSSASLEGGGEFECYGTAWNYMLAGCPAVVGALWDVTDREVDRFAGRVFEEWGLVERGTFREEEKKGKGKGRAKGDDEEERGGASLVEAVARGREACRFRYLTAAAMCVYGIPVYIK